MGKARHDRGDGTGGLGLSSHPAYIPLAPGTGERAGVRGSIRLDQYESKTHGLNLLRATPSP